MTGMRANPDGRQNEAASAGVLLQHAGANRLVVMQAIIVVVLLVSAQAYDGSTHSISHWIVVGAYSACSIALGLAERFGRDVDARPGSERRAEWLAWASTGLNALVVVYIEIEHMIAGAIAGFDETASAVSRLPAFLLLLQTALSMRVWHTVVFAGVVSAAWGAAIVLAFRHSSTIVLGPHVALSEEAVGLLTFVVASLLVVDGVRRLRLALTTALRLEHERTMLARFVPDSVAVRLALEGGLGSVRERHACLLALDIRAFSKLTRERPREEVVRTLLDVRALVHQAVTRHGGIVDKYVGDGTLAQFMVGRPREQARDALACARAVLARLAILNDERRAEDLPVLRLTLALHAGDVLAGVFDDGMRAEFTVLGPAMNALARLETRAKQADLAIGASEEFVSLLDRATAHGARAAPDHEEGGPKLFVLASESVVPTEDSSAKPPERPAYA